MPRPRLSLRRHLGNDESVLVQRPLPLLVLGWIEDVDTARDHADGPVFESTVVGGAVDPAG